MALPELAPDQIHFWWISLAKEIQRPFVDERVLNPGERERASRLLFTEARRRFVVGRCWQRRLLASYVGQAMDAVDLVADENGKPHLSVHGEVFPLAINYSQSGNLGLLAIADRASIGVDLEQVRLLGDFPSLAEQCFSPREQRALVEAAEHRRSQLFYTVWTQKEALVKLTGEGLRADLQRLTVEADPESPGGLAVGDGAYDPSVTQSATAFFPGGWRAAWAWHGTAPETRWFTA